MLFRLVQSLIRLALLAFFAIAPIAAAHAQATLSDTEKATLERAREALRRIEPLVEQRGSSFADLQELRDEVDPYRDQLRDLTRELQDRVSAAQARLRALGPSPAANAPAERGDVATDRRRYTALVAELEGHLGSARAVLTEADQLWEDITERRRSLFTSRLFEHRESFFDPAFWSDLLETGMPDFSRRAGLRIGEIVSDIEENEAWPTLAWIGVMLLALVVGLFVLHRWLSRRRARHAADDDTAPSRGAIVLRALVILVMRAVPFAALAFALALAVSRFELVNEAVETFLMGLAGTLFAFGLGSGAVRAAFSPRAPAYRVLAASDVVARRAVRVVTVLFAIILLGIVGHGLEQLVVARTSVTIANAGLTSLCVIVVGAALMVRARADEGPVVGLVPAPLHLLRPIFWVCAAIVLAALVFGYISLAHFIAARAIATAAVLCLATLVYVTIDAILHDALAPGTLANERVSRTFGIKPATVDLLGTVFAGVLRVLTVVVTLVVLFSPWGVQFGGMNPLDDAFFGLRFGDLRGVLGAAGIALTLFVVGLLATRMFVTWLDGQLLPRTNVDVGVRHSITTVAGYVGLVAALALALAQAGVELQNVALVAGALSVGIGFGLQQVVSNFVAGLILLAERPIRVGDIISVKGEEGKVTKISVRATELALAEKSNVIVPNADLISSTVKNRSLLDPTQRIRVTVTVTHEADLDVALAVLVAAATHERAVAGTTPRANVLNVTPGGIELEVWMICDSLDVTDVVRTQIISGIVSRFRAAGIEFARGPDTPAPAAKPAAA